MTSVPGDQPAATLRGDQRPRILWRPPAVSSAGQEVVELAASAGLILDPWEAFALDVALGEREDGNWAAFEVGVLVSRQNGKGAILEARELGGLYLFGERLLLHSAHEFKTCLEGFRRVLALIENSDHLRRRVKRVRTSHGEESIELLGEGRQLITGGQRLLFVARTGGSGRGFTGDCIILDEAFNLPETATEAMLPTVSARPNPQIWYTSSAPDKELAPCEVLARVRRRGINGGEPALAYLEWSIDPHVAECPVVCAEHDDPADPRSWAKANPGLGIRISVEHVAREMASMSAGGFQRERLGVGNWPADEEDWQVISAEQWAALADPASQVVGPMVLAAAIPPDASWGAIGVAGRRADGLVHAEVVEYVPRTSWMAGRLLELQEIWQPLAVVVDGTGPAGVLVGPLLAAGFAPLPPMKPAARGDRVLLRPFAREVGAACAWLYQAATDALTLRHLDQPELSAALAGAQQRTIGDGAWAWSRKGSGVDISPLEAVTLALWGFMSREHLPQEQVEKDYHYDPYPELERELEQERELERQQAEVEEPTVEHGLIVDAYGRYVSPGSG